MNWLLPSELSFFRNTFQNLGKKVFLKSSIDPLVPLRGRPYGGIGFVCEIISGYTHMFEDYDSDRICALKVYQAEKLILTVYGLYMPYNNHCAQQLECYLEILDKLQSLLDSNDNGVPVVIVRDMNTSLPNSRTLKKNWYRRHPFSRQSALLFKFLCQNDLCVANFAFKQNVEHTYRKQNVRSYIDHILVPGYLLDKTLMCNILDETAENVSDHLALNLQLDMSAPEVNNVGEYYTMPEYPRPKWDDSDFCQNYSKEAKLAFSKLKPWDLKTVTHSNAKQTIDKLCNKLSEILHHSVKMSLRNNSGSNNKNINTFSRKRTFNKNKTWWNTDCATARRRNKLFYYIWKENASPTSGEIYECYKSARRGYRKACRSAMKNSGKLSHQALDSLFKVNKAKQMWKLIRKAKSSSTSHDTGITLDTLSGYYSNKFSATSTTCETILNAENNVKNKYERLRSNTNEVVFSEQCVIRYIRRLKPGTSPGHDGISPEHLKNALKSELPMYMSILFTLCLRYGLVPDSFFTGLLVPVLKKSGLDPLAAKNYRPITVSIIFSKILEYFILDQCSHHIYSDFQFGFIQNRSTSMATSLAHDVCVLLNAQG